MGVDEVEMVTDDPALDDVENRLISIVRNKLNVPCTLDDNFFALGGGSLDALEVLARIREEFGVRIKLREFFRAGTVRELRHLIGSVA
ncbi:acyl carrier protein [Kitasatospora kifunensis]|uniref:Acyl carrier protein n=1 Tax=Kitasatospora kifunensis TaxID=58351 RepID=A0A7W7VV93_KITKI|nr:acyl carrier protein [Kitasatospora kifunensis]MBB4923459.1 acyl carrier protein [Kitasatospora kifunensis]